MKRKIVNGILLMALVVSSVSSFVSCKDYDEDIRTSLEGKLNNETALREALAAQLQTLKTSVDQMQAQLNNLKSCECNLSEYLKKGDLGDYATKAELNALLSRIAAIETAKALMEERIAAIEDVLKTLDSRVGTVEQKVILLDTEIAAAKASAAEALQKATDALNKANEALEKQQTPYDDTVLKGMITNLNEVVNTLKTTVANLEARVIAVEGIAKDALEKAQAAQQTANSNYLTIESLKSQIETLNKWVENHGNTESYDDATLRQLIKDLTERIENIETSYCTKCDLEVAMALAKKANDAIASLRDSIARGDIVTLGQLKDSLDKYVTKVEFYDSIKWIRDSIDNFSKRIALLEDTVSALTADFRKMITGIIVQGTQSPVLGYFNAPLDTRATVLAVYYGTPDAKWEFPSTIPANYVNGNADFALWTERNIKITGALTSIPGFVSGNSGKNLVSMNENGDEEGNAGTLYVTVNPSNVDMTGETLKLKDSKDGDAYATLSELKPSDRLLTFGYTRAENGFYEAKATIKADDVENAALKVDYESLEEDAKTIWREHSKSSVLEMGSSLVKLFQDMIPAYAVMGSWTDKLDGKEHKIYSQYNVAATAIKPLSFNFMNGASVSSMPGVGRVQDIVGEIVDKINIKVNVANGVDFSKYQSSVVFKDIDLSSVTTTVTFTINYTLMDPEDPEKVAYFLVTDGKYRYLMKDETDPWVFNIDLSQWQTATWNVIRSVPVTINMNQDVDMSTTLQQIINEINKQYGSNGNASTKLAELLNDVASLGNIDNKINASIDDAKTEIKSQINSLITRANNKLTKWFNRLPGFLNLALVGGKDHNIGLLSQSKYYATQASGSLKLVPTTYSLELLAPAYKKLVIVSDVFNADGTPVAESEAKSLASAANGENMGKVIDTDKTCTLNAGQSGKIYEITYTAMDYFGKVAIKKYYVKF